ncbi:MAG: protocatechuate 3,4-dioxygenase subunit alpha [Candidatus Acidiferrum sp.]|jgi:protocatechuate 3,4-dioxygenase alpha subunit
MNLYASAWQTVGPFFSIGMNPRYLSDIAGPNAAGERIAIAGRVFDGADAPIRDAVLEIWQANAHGKYAHPEDLQDKPWDPGFRGYGRIPTDDNGAFRFTTIKPGSVDSPGGVPQAPHLVVNLMMRGLLRGLTTRIYFPNEGLNDRDEILRLVEPERRNTLLLVPEGAGGGHFRWDVHMQGKAETVFFDF